MQDLRDIIKRYNAARQASRPVALATVVNVLGSAYRRAGARLLVVDGQGFTGSLSGGCLEKDVSLRAQEVIETGVPQVLSYSTTGSADDYIFGVGQGCSGTVEIIVERLAPSTDSALNPLQILDTGLTDRKTGVLVTLLSIDGETGEAPAPGARDGSVHAEPGTALWVDESMALQVNQSIDAAFLKEVLTDHASQVLKERKSSCKKFDTALGAVSAFFEFRQPPIQLLICGNGNDALAVGAFGKQLGWDVVFADLKNPASMFDGVRNRERTAALLMTHNYERDLTFLQQSINAGLDYIGMLGPKHRQEKLLQDLAIGGIHPGDEALIHIYGPMGLDLGADNEQEIALAVVSEVQAVLNGHAAGSLRDKTSSIHAANGASPVQSEPACLNQAEWVCRTQA